MKTPTFPGHIIPPIDEEPISTFVLEDGGQGLCDELTERVLGGLVRAVHLIDNVGVVQAPIWQQQEHSMSSRIVVKPSEIPFSQNHNHF